MLRITTTNGDTLIHADQQSDAIKLTATDGSRVMVHAGEWGKHKYIRKEGNRYIYPEDLEGTAGGRVAKRVSDFGNSLGRGVNTVANAGSALRDRATNTFNQASNAATYRVNQATQTAQRTGHNIKTNAQNLHEKADNAVDAARIAQENANRKLVAKGQNVINSAKTTANETGSRIKAKAQSAHESADNTLNKAKTAQENAGRKIKSKADSTVKSAKDFGESTGKKIKSKADSAARSAREFKESTEKKAKSGMRDLQERANNTLHEAKSAQENFNNETKKKVKRKRKSLGNKISDLGRRIGGE